MATRNQHWNWKTSLRLLHLEQLLLLERRFRDVSVGVCVHSFHGPLMRIQIPALRTLFQGARWGQEPGLGAGSCTAKPSNHGRIKQDRTLPKLLPPSWKPRIIPKSLLVQSLPVHHSPVVMWFWRSIPRLASDLCRKARVQPLGHGSPFHEAQIFPSHSCQRRVGTLQPRTQQSVGQSSARRPRAVLDLALGPRLIFHSVAGRLLLLNAPMLIISPPFDRELRGTEVLMRCF